MPSVQPRALLAAILLCATVSTAHAEDVDFWNFRNSMPKEAGTNGLTTVEITEEGLFVRTSSEGVVSWSNQPLDMPAEVVTLRVRSSRAVVGHIVWAPTDGSEEGTLYQVPFEIPITEISRDIDVVLNNFPTWDWRTETIGIVFPAGTELILEEMNFRHWSPMERMIEGWKSFWTFDEFKPHSINFLWGPLITGSEPGREQLFDELPPYAGSATRVFYVVLFAAGVIGIIIAYGRRNRSLGLGVFIAVFCALWLLFDIRMGAEILSYAANDLRTYVFEDKDERWLRTHGTIYATFDEVLPAIREHDRYALLSPAGSIVYPNLRYFSYPSVPVLPGQDTSDMKLFVVFGDTSIRIDEEGRLVRLSASGSGAEILSPPGAVTKRIHDSIFLFETR